MANHINLTHVHSIVYHYKTHYYTAKLSMEFGMLKWDSFFLVSVHDNEATGPAVQSDDRVLNQKL